MFNSSQAPVNLDTLQVTRQSLSEQVADQIQHLIVDGGLQPGDRLPPERELGERLGVSRTVIREATKLLQERGLVKVITGSGTYVSKVEPETVSQSIGLFVRGHKPAFRDLLEIRKSLEVEMAGLAAQRASPEDIERLEGTLAQMRRAAPQVEGSPARLEEFIQADMLFHQVLADASRNSLLPVLLTPITSLLLEFRRELSSVPGAPENAVRYHQDILECIRNRDSQRCREVMHAHMSNAEEYLERVEDEAEGT